MKSENFQPRSATTRSSLMRAAEKLSAERGAENVTLRDVFFNMLIDAMAGLLAAEVSAQTHTALASTEQAYSGALL